MRKRVAVYPGSFDPITYGHIAVVKRALSIFDEIVVSVIDNPEKETLFSLTERMAIAGEGLKGMGRRVKVDGFHGLLVDYVKQVKACAILRGLRAVSDFDYEFQMALTNHQLYPQVATMFLMTDAKYSYLSSSLVKQIAHFDGDVKDFVPPGVAKKLYTKLGRMQRK